MDSSLTKADWLTAERATAWCRVLAVCEAVWLSALIIRRHDLPYGDFGCFWAASKLALQGSMSAVYDPAAMAAVEHSTHILAADLVQPFLYPPPYLLLCLPLAFMKLRVAAVVFMLAGLVPFLFCVGRLLPWRRYWLPIVAFPGVMVTAGSGQNGFFSAACFGGGAVLLDRYPFCAGVCLGLLTCKPHLAVLAPIAFIAARRWRALAGAAASALGISALSCLILGAKVWLLLPAAMGAAGHVALALLEPEQLQSLYGAALILHTPGWLAATCQAAFSLAVISLLIHAVRSRPGGRAEGAALAMASLAAAPYLMDYDLAILAIPLAWLFGQASTTRWRPWEKYAAACVFMMPLLTRGLAQRIGVPLAPVALAWFVTVIIGRVAAEPRTVAIQQGVFAEI